jgi:hypothetical protein
MAPEVRQRVTRESAEAFLQSVIHGYREFLRTSRALSPHNTYFPVPAVLPEHLLIPALVRTIVGWCAAECTIAETVNNETHLLILSEVGRLGALRLADAGKEAEPQPQYAVCPLDEATGDAGLHSFDSSTSASSSQAGRTWWSTAARCAATGGGCWRRSTVPSKCRSPSRAPGSSPETRPGRRHAQTAAGGGGKSGTHDVTPGGHPTDDAADDATHPLEHLPKNELPALVSDLRAALDTVEATGDVKPLVVELAAWIHTAQIHGDLELAARLRQPAADGSRCGRRCPGHRGQRTSPAVFGAALRTPN